MARARNIKPAFFKNYELADAGPVAQILFAGLWCLADREGRLEDKPRFIKAELFPYYDCDVNGELTELQRLGFVRRYVNAGVAVVEVLNFKKHQTPHNTEKASTLPEFIAGSEVTPPLQPAPTPGNGGLTVNSPSVNDGKTPDSLIPDSLSSDSPTSDSLIPEEKRLQLALVQPEKVRQIKSAKPKTENQQANAATWQAYAQAYFLKYGVEPVTNAKTWGQVASLVARLGMQEAPHVAGYFLTMQKAFYVSSMHPFGALLQDCEGIRTQWATNRQMTDTRARQADQTQSNRSTVDEALDLIRQQRELA